MSLRDRAKAAGIDAATIAAILCVAPSSAYRALDGSLPSRRAEAIISAWEIMTPDQRRAWLDALGVPTERRRRGRPPSRADLRC